MRSYFALTNIFLLCLPGFLIQGCYIKNGPVETEETLTIASDYLQPSDTILFNRFSSEKNVRIKIKSLNAEAIIKTVKKAPYNHGFDLYMMQHTHSVLKLHKSGAIQPLSNDTKGSGIDTNLICDRFDFITFGIDPFLLVTPSHIAGEKTIEVLYQTPYTSTLHVNEEIALLSHLKANRSNAQAYAHMKKMAKMKQNEALADTVEFLLTTFSTYCADTSFKAQYPDTYFLGTPYQQQSAELRTLCIGRQAQSYKLAQAFINHYLNPAYNEKLASALHVIPVYDYLSAYVKELDFEIKKAMSLTQYYVIVDRMLKKL